MTWKERQHRAVSGNVIRRRVADEVIYALVTFGTELAFGGRRSFRDQYWEDLQVYHAAVYRLRRDGLVVKRGRGATASIELTSKGLARLPPVLGSKAPWPASWDGSWYLLMYDIPETARPFSDVLRRFLQQKRMGCLQRSVWISPIDLRPDYQDLMDTTDLKVHSFLTPVRSFYGLAPAQVVEKAWNLERVEEVQSDYCRQFGKRLQRIGEDAASTSEVFRAAREEQAAFLAAMEEDPLLPRPLWPEGYRGEEAWKLHREFGQAVKRRVSSKL